MKFDALNNPYKCKRYTAYAKYGMVATSQPMAAAAGMEILKKGGNAIDAAVAVAACLTVCEPTSNGIGGDAFAIAAVGGKLYGLNASGPSPMAISIDKLEKRGYKEIPRYGFVPVNVPGAPAAWAALSRRFGKLPLKEALAPAIRYAQEGYVISVILGKNWNKAYNIYKENLKGDEFKYWFETFAPKGRAPKAGEIMTLPDHAKTLIKIAETDAEAFYRGELAERIDAFSRRYGGYIRKEDLENYKAEWVEPIYTKYRDYEVCEIPPNGQGIVALMALNILKGFEFREKDSLDTYHKQIEAIKLAFEDAQRYVTDMRKMKVKVEDLLSDAWADEKRKRIGSAALTPLPSEEQRGGTVYLATADGEGNMVSFIQSNYMGFGSGLVVPETGIALQNRGRNFSFDPGHDNALEPGKKTYHTIIPGFLTKDKKPVGPFGVMGGFMQPQGHVQVIMNLIDFNLNPQAALDAPRWQWIRGKKVELEDTLPEEIAKALEDIGHEVTVTDDNTGYGRGQIILRDESGVLAGGTENRTDGTILAW
ncbi:gamma-glutamyltransferase [Lutispora saccharofermentans]|uniref:Glutathione hydrolase proenzyme n=1 Tax=Lutispora saccharofermentans TaxID=3024236 RepID=A0ABT1NFM6_9FIRM|nr:gamma-glutamyltransferase [Lutispora saccharofermentans]MCQ1530038.1 gamma-glutamyltransferase [Lutispora saccharofermentans]